MSGHVLRGVKVLDATGRDPYGPTTVVVDNHSISEIGPHAEGQSDDRSYACDGLTLMPGLTDAHAHVASLGTDFGPGDGSWVDYVVAVQEVLGDALDEGFTTLRDAGGCDPAFARAIEAGVIRGPQLLPAGSELTETGGHGDYRAPTEDGRIPSIPGLYAAPDIVDGADAVRAAAREQFRKGATQIKLVASGGVISPTDQLGSSQFNANEIAAAVEVASSRSSYVMAHCHHSEAIQTLVSLGVRSIEHAALMDEETAGIVSRAGAFVVPTLAVMEMLPAHGEVFGLSPNKRDLIRRLADQVMRTLPGWASTGLRLGSGSDLIGPHQRGRARELVLKAEALGPRAAIESATRVNAELFGLDAIGTVEVGKQADLILVDGDPLQDISVLAAAERIPYVFKRGVLVKDLRAVRTAS